MSVIFNALENENKIENRAENRKEEIKVVAPASESLVSLKLGLAFSFFLAFIGLVSVVYFFQALNSEKKDREVFESGYAQFQGKVQMLEYDLNKVQTEADQLRTQVKTYASDKAEFVKKIEESQLTIASLQAKTQALETSGQASREEIKKLSQRFASQGSLVEVAL